MLSGHTEDAGEYEFVDIIHDQNNLAIPLTSLNICTPMKLSICRIICYFFFQSLFMWTPLNLKCTSSAPAKKKQKNKGNDSHQLPQKSVGGKMKRESRRDKGKTWHLKALHFTNSLKVEKWKMAKQRLERKRETDARVTRSVVHPLTLISYLHLLRGPLLKVPTFLTLNTTNSLPPTITVSG